MEGEEGRRARFEGVFRKHQAAVRAYALRRADHARAQDAVSETFLIAWRRFDDLPEEPLPWLFGTTRRVLANQRRAEGHQRSVADRVAAEPAASAPDPAQLLGDAGALLCALGRLGAQDRETLTLVAWEGLDPGAAARASGCSRAAFAVRLHRARRRLERALATAGHGTVTHEQMETA